jgi:hypothetical protein
LYSDVNSLSRTVIFLVKPRVGGLEVIPAFTPLEGVVGAQESTTNVNAEGYPGANN